MPDQIPLPPAPPDLSSPTPVGVGTPKKSGGKGWLVPVAIAVALIAIIGTIAYTSSVHQDAGSSASPQAPTPGQPSVTSPPAPSAPVGLKAIPEGLQVTLTWKPAPGSGKDTRYEIDRGTDFEHLTSKLSYVDKTVAPQTTYH